MGTQWDTGTPRGCEEEDVGVTVGIVPILVVTPVSMCREREGTRGSPKSTSLD